jgi:hypothetical protein
LSVLELRRSLLQILLTLLSKLNGLLLNDIQGDIVVDQQGLEHRLQQLDVELLLLSVDLGVGYGGVLFEFLEHGGFEIVLGGGFYHLVIIN